MNLSPADAECFFKLMFSLQRYVNQKRRIRPEVETLDDYLDLPYEDKLEVRNAVYEHSELIDAFLADNPDDLTAEELMIVQRWKGFVAGQFFIERFLKKHSIWIAGGSNAKVYAVLALNDPLEKIFFGRGLPMLVRSVLLPFKGRIIYDGVTEPYSAFFGGGVKAELREVYMTAKQNRRIIETLEPEIEAERRRRQAPKPADDCQLAVDALVAAANKLKGRNVPVRSEAFSLLKASARLAQTAVHHGDDLDQLWSRQKSVQRCLRRLETVLYRAE